MNRARAERPGPASPFESRSASLSARLRAWTDRASDWLIARELAWSILFFLVVLVLLQGSVVPSLPPGFAEGEAAPYDVRARTEAEFVDDALTEEMRNAARDAVPEVYEHDPLLGQRLVAELREIFRIGRSSSSVGDRTEPERAAAFEKARAAVREAAGEKAAATIAADGFSEAAERAAAAAVGRVMQGLIVASKASVRRQGVILVVRVPGGEEERVSGVDGVSGLDDAKARAASEIRDDAALPPALADALAALAGAFVDANVTRDPEGTAARRAAAADAVPPATTKIPAGSVIVHAGERLTAARLAAVDPSGGKRTGAERWLRLAGLAVVAGLLAFFLYRYARYHQRGFRKIRRLHALLVVVILSMLLLSQLILWIVREVVEGVGEPFRDVGLYAYLVPLAGGSILVALLASARIAMVYSGMTAILFGGMTGWDAYRLTWAILAQWAGVYAVTSYRERAALLRAGLTAGLGGALAAIATESIRTGVTSGGRAPYAAGLAFVGGAVGTGLVVSFALPLLERLFHVLTDVRLLELSNVNHPLLAQMALKAPGTYSHSLTVGSLAEEAARAIAANSLFCRVAAFYHDIGKIRKPQYFVENQRGGNPHDRLTPSMSALIISSHVKDGIRLAKEAGLPQQIVDIIPQHHGTRVMTFFYDKAKKSSDPALGSVSEADFRYPGPRPRTKEAAIFMLADAVEAAARTLDEPTPGRLREVIHKVANHIVFDGQLDECDLTFAELERIEDAFLRTLASMYHHRIDYPGFEFARPRAEGRAGSEAAERHAAAKGT